MLALIVAVADNGAIGKDNQLLWHIPEDLQYFKKLTTGHTIVMGRKTLESLPFKLPNRTHWVITRHADYEPPYEDVQVFTSVQAVLKAIPKEEVVYCIGGAEIYKELMPYADYVYMTEVHEDFEGDVYFPTLGDAFEEVSRKAAAMHSPLSYEFVTYERKKN